MMEEQNNESKKQVADQMIQSIFDSVNRLELHQRIMEEGVDTLPEFISIPPEQWKIIIPQAQLKNLSLMITEFKIILAKIKPILSKEKYEQLIKKLNFCIELQSKESIFYKGKEIKLYSYGHNFQKQTWIVLGSLFDVLVKMLSNLRTELLESLSHILYAFDKNKSNKPM